MEQQAKERLTGGVILVALLVLLVPELLTGPRPPPQVAPAQPDQAPIRSYTLDLGESVHANSAPVTASTAAPPASEPVARVPLPSAPAAMAAVPAHPETTAPAPPAATAASPAAAPAAPAPLHAAGHPPAHPPEHGAEHNTEHGAEHSSGGWTVQLGTFSSRENAAHLIAGLKSHGFSAAIVESTKSTHKLYRVRVGAEHDLAAAQKLLARLRAAGQKGGEIVPR